MKMRVTLFPSTVDKPTQAERKGLVYVEEVHDIGAARIAWANMLQLGIFVKSENRFIPPHRIAGASVVDE
jgi:hypothetical protein